VLHQEWLDQNKIVSWREVTSTQDSGMLYHTCGDWDLLICLPKQLLYHHKKVPSSFHAWINIKEAFAENYSVKAKGMTNMLKHMDLELEGRHHSGIDDCRHIARICQRMLKDGWKPTAPQRPFYSTPGQV
jgi:inhibitor of KinA sporulation pathway (predicted exonuclease)